jgi:hypothetical protein
MRGLGAHPGDFVPAVTLDDDRNVANDNAADAWDAYEMSAKRTVLALRPQTAQGFLMVEVIATSAATGWICAYFSAQQQWARCLLSS